MNSPHFPLGVLLFTLGQVWGCPMTCGGDEMEPDPSEQLAGSEGISCTETGFCKPGLSCQPRCISTNCANPNEKTCQCLQPVCCANDAKCELVLGTGARCDTSIGKCMRSSGTGGGGGSSASGTARCVDKNGVCIQYLSAVTGSVADFKAQCQGEGGTYSTSACSNCGSGPYCANARLTAKGQKYIGNICYGAGFCSRFPTVDTRTTCTSVGGTSRTADDCKR